MHHPSVNEAKVGSGLNSPGSYGTGYLDQKTIGQNSKNLPELATEMDPIRSWRLPKALGLLAILPCNTLASATFELFDPGTEKNRPV
jgi:hypothetical protein